MTTNVDAERDEARDRGERGMVLVPSTSLDARADVAGAYEGLTTVNLRANGLRTLKDIAHLPSVRVLDVSANALVALDGLSDVLGASLRTLDVSDNAIGTLEGLGRSAPGLRRLRARNCGVDRDGVGAHPSLIELDLGGNGLEEIPDCSRCPGLRIVRLRRNAISSLALARSRLPATTSELDVRENDLADAEEFRFLRYFPRLSKFWFSGNPVDARAVHYGYDARALVAFCAPTIRECDGERASGSTWAFAGKKLFRNDAGELCDELLAILNERASPWVLGEYLRNAGCARTETSPTAQTRERSAMFSVSSFVPVRRDDEADVLDEEDSERSDDGFEVEARRMYAEVEELDHTAHWLSRVASESGDEDDEKDEEAPRPFTMDALAMISPIRTLSNAKRYVGKIEEEEEDDDATEDDASTQSAEEEFYSLEDCTATVKTPTVASATTPSRSGSSTSRSQTRMRLVRASPRGRGPNANDLKGVADVFLDRLSAQESPMNDSPDLRPRAATNRGSFVFTDDSDSFAVHESFDAFEDEDEASLRSFLLLGDENDSGVMSPLMSPRAGLRSALKTAVDDLAHGKGGGGTPERLARCAKKIETMIDDIKRTRVRSGDS